MAGDWSNEQNDAIVADYLEASSVFVRGLCQTCYTRLLTCPGNSSIEGFDRGLRRDSNEVRLHGAIGDNGPIASMRPKGQPAHLPA